MCLSATFAPAPGSPVATGERPDAVAVADLDGDGRSDLAVANYGSNTVSVLLGTGDGRFRPAPGSPSVVGTSPIALAVADFNGDGRSDLAVANFNVSADGFAVSVLLGTGGGRFAPARASPITVNGPALSVAAADLDGDGRADLIVGVRAGGADVNVLLGRGNGTFRPAPGSPFASAGVSRSVAVADFDGDGRPDLATANLYDDRVSVLLGAGGGRFAPAPGSPVTVGDAPRSVVVGDFDGDGRPDLAAADYGTDGVTVLLGAGGGRFAPAPGSPVADGDGPNAVAVADLDGDGRLDLAVANTTSRDVSVLLGVGGGRFSTNPGPPVAAHFDFGGAVAAGDLDGDGRPDLATAQTDGVGVLLNVTPSVFTLSPDQTVAEGDDGTRTLTFTATLSPARARTTTVKYSTGDESATAGSDYVGTFGTLTFPPGVTSRSFAVRVKGDLTVEPTERFKVVLYGASAGAVVGDGFSRVTLTNDDPAPPATPRVSVGGVSLTEGGAGTTKAFRFAVTLDAASASPVTVRYTTGNGTAAGGSDYAAAAGIVKFAANETLRFVTVVVRGDAVRELDETFFLNLSAATNATIGVGRATGTIRNDD